VTGQALKQELPPWMTAALRQLEDCGAETAGSNVLLVKIDEQTLYLLSDGRIEKSWPVSTSKFGVGNQSGSYKTPSGVHRVAEKIGAGCRLREIIRTRIPTGEIAPLSDALSAAPASRDMITTRILWLQGLQPGVNSGGSVDSYLRYIYIHGTPEERLLGSPSSIGCVRMGNEDVIELFEQVEVGTLVNIVP
jgi:lipoprotein-anchoring transpeptidase ErfK/SrfK